MKPEPLPSPPDPRQTGLFGTEAPCDYCASGVHVHPELLPKCPKCKRSKRSCNAHYDCDAAEEINPYVVHCHDPECPVCIG